jgi:hypothetical protein
MLRIRMLVVLESRVCLTTWLFHIAIDSWLPLMLQACLSEPRACCSHSLPQTCCDTALHGLVHGFVFELVETGSTSRRLGNIGLRMLPRHAACLLSLNATLHTPAAAAGGPASNAVK